MSVVGLLLQPWRNMSFLSELFGTGGRRIPRRRSLDLEQLEPRVLLNGATETIGLLALSEEAASFACQTEQSFVTGAGADGPVITDVQTGFQLALTPTVLAGGQIQLDIDLSGARLDGPVVETSVQGPLGRQDIQVVDVEDFAAEGVFTVADGETFELLQLPGLGPIEVTPRLLVVDSIEQVQVTIELPDEALDLQFPAGPAELVLVTVADQCGSVGSGTRYSLVTGFDSGGAVVGSAESGLGMTFGSAVSADGLYVTSSVELMCASLAWPVETFKVRTPFGRQRIQLPVVHTLTLDTDSAAPDGATVMLAQAGGRPVLATPVVVATGAVDSVVVMQAELPTAGGGPEPFGAMSSFGLLAASGQEGSLMNLVQQDFVTGAGPTGPAVSPNSTGLRLEHSSTVSPDHSHITSSIEVTQFALAGPVETFKVRTPFGKQRIQQPVLHTLMVDTDLAAADGATLLVAQIGDLPVLVTPSVVATDEDALGVFLEAMLPMAAESDALLVCGPASEVSVVVSDGQSASLDSLTNRRFVTGSVTGDPVVSTTETGLELEYEPTVSPGGSDVASSMRLTLSAIEDRVDTLKVRTPFGKQRVQQPVMHSLSIDTSYAAAHGSSVVVATIGGEPVIATSTIIHDGTAPDNVLLQLDLPVSTIADAPSGALPGPLSLVAADGGAGQLSNLTVRRFVTGFSAGDPVTSATETGVSLSTRPTVSADQSQIANSVQVAYAAPVGRTETFKVRTPFGKQRVQQPVTHLLSLETCLTAGPGDTLVTAMVGDVLVFATQQVIVDSGPTPQVLTEIEFPPWGPAPAGGPMSSFDLSTRDGQPGSLLDMIERDLVTGFSAGVPVVSTVETGVALEYTPTVSADRRYVTGPIRLTYIMLEEPVETFKVRTPLGKQRLHLTMARFFLLDTDFAASDGGTLAVAGVYGLTVFATPSADLAGDLPLPVDLTVQLPVGAMAGPSP